MTFGWDWWIYFNIGLLILLLLDVGFIRKKAHAYLLTGAWIAVAALFALFIYLCKGDKPTLEFVTGYLIEESLSVDNLFVFLTIFQYFHVPKPVQTKILMYGIIGALVLRLAFILAGIALISKVHWVLYLFGAFLVFTGITMFKKAKPEMSPRPTFLVNLLQKFLPIKETWEKGHFFVREQGKLFATTSFVVLCMIESTDLVFALDSIPAVFAITLDPFIVYSCNALAIMGLRSLFFVLKDMLEAFSFLHYGVCLILIFVGCKMLLAPIYPIPTTISLAVIATTLAVSLILGKKE